MADPVTKLFGEAWNEGRLEVVGELVAPGFITHAGEAEIRGPEELARVISSWRQAFPDLLYEVDERIEQGDLVVTRWRARGTHRGEFAGIPPTGRRMSYWGITIWRVSGGVIQESWVTATVPEMLASLRGES